MNPITVLWYGAGQDSTAILYKSVYDEAFKAKYIKGELVVICADTGNEFPETYRYIQEHAQPFCQAHGIHFAHIKPEMGFHPKTWHSLTGQFERTKGVMSVAFPKTCTDNLKIKPCYNYLEWFLCQRYGFEKSKPKSAYYRYAEMFGKLDVIIGFGSDESKRISLVPANLLFDIKPIRNTVPVFVQKCVNKIYPLINEGMSRGDCQKAIHDYGHEVPAPSNCMMCPFADEREVLYLSMAYPSTFSDWRMYEQIKLVRINRKATARNLGVKGKLTLGEYLAKAQAKYGHMTLEELKEHRFSHGHCVKSRY